MTVPIDWQAPPTGLTNGPNSSDTCTVRKILVRELKRGSVSMDLVTRTVRRDGHIVAMTTSEFELLRVLMESAGAPAGRQDLSKSVFDREYSVFDRAIDNLVSALRRKLGATPEGLERIKSIRHVGYMYTDVDAPRS
jgi:DNA-binding response OmpR family regulator